MNRSMLMNEVGAGRRRINRDHADGNVEMVALLGGADRVEVVGGDTRIPALSRKVGDHDSFNIGSLSVKVIFSPWYARCTSRRWRMEWRSVLID